MILSSNQVQSSGSQNSQLTNTELLSLLERFLMGCKQAIKSGKCALPLYYFMEELNPNTMCYNLAIRQQFILNTASLGKFGRLLEIVIVSINNLKQGKNITKRNLYYKLQQYYNDYSTIDKDLRLICHNLYYLYQQTKQHQLCPISTITKNMLCVIASNRCIMFGNACVTADGRVLNGGRVPEFDIITLPTCKKVTAKSMVTKIIIVEKESFFYELVTVFKQFKLADQYLLISGRGYPDLNTRELLLQLCSQSEPQIQTIYYLGDYDVYGFDIFLFYAFGDWTCKGIFSKIQLLEIGSPKNLQYFNNSLKQEMNRFTKQDHKKVKEVSTKLDKLKSKMLQNGELKITCKISRVSQYFQQFTQSESKCELQLYHDCATRALWVHEIIKEQEKQLI